MYETGFYERKIVRSLDGKGFLATLGIDKRPYDVFEKSKNGQDKVKEKRVNAKSGWNVFVSEFSKGRRGLTGGIPVKEAAQEWDSMSEEKKEPYLRKAAEINKLRADGTATQTKNE